MTYKAFKAGTVLSVLILFAALYYRRQVDEVLRDRLISVLEGLVKVERQHTVISKPKVAIGYGACTDVFVNGKELLKYNVAADEPQHFYDITSYEELVKTYAYFFRHGAAAERYISNGTLFDEIVEAAKLTEGTHNALGGNAAVMATRFVQEGCQVLLAAKMTSELKKTLPKGVNVVGGDTAKDDIHLILEYKADEEWGIYKSPRANRFIIHNDENNPHISSLEEFDKLLKEFEPNLLVVSGLQMMDNYPFSKDVREQRLEKIREQMLTQPLKTKIHFEMASFAEAQLLKQITEYVTPFCDSLGMNEQELANLYHIVVYNNISLVSDSNPRVATVLDQMRNIFRLMTSRREEIQGSRPLTRIHVHTLAYQAILTVKGSQWKNAKAAAAKASLTANRHVCGSKEVDIDKAKLIMDESFSTSITEGSKRVPLDVEQPVSCWDEEIEMAQGMQVPVEICVAPVLVCTEAFQTAGGGDNISSAGLSMQI